MLQQVAVLRTQEDPVFIGLLSIILGSLQGKTNTLTHQASTSSYKNSLHRMRKTRKEWIIFSAG